MKRQFKHHCNYNDNIPCIRYVFIHMYNLISIYSNIAWCVIYRSYLGFKNRNYIYFS